MQRRGVVNVGLILVGRKNVVNIINVAYLQRLALVSTLEGNYACRCRRETLMTDSDVLQRDNNVFGAA